MSSIEEPSVLPAPAWTPRGTSLRIGIAGLGTVGAATVRLLHAEPTQGLVEGAQCDATSAV